MAAIMATIELFQPGGYTEDFKGFTSKSLANEWISKKLRTWLDESKASA